MDTLLEAGNWTHHQSWFDDVDELAVRLGLSNSELIKLGRSRGRIELVSGNISDLGFQATKATGRNHLRAGLPPGTVIMQFDRGSKGERRIAGQALEGNDVIIGYSGTQFDLVTAEEHDGFNFRLPESLIRVALHHREPVAEMLLQGSALQVIKRGDLWVRRVRILAEAIFSLRMQSSGPRAYAYAHAELSDMLVATLLLPWRRSESVAFRPARYQRLPLVRRVIEFMRENLGEPLMMHDLCKAARASERSVDYAFREVCGVGPKQYLRILRLHRVRRDLKALPFDVSTVTTIAHLNGFWHMGHFSRAYRELFGETPRQTRQRYT